MDDLTINDFSTFLNSLTNKCNTLLDCPVRFSGVYGEQNVQHFIEYIQSYKKVKCITDGQALQELGNLLTEHAYTWWLRRKCHFTTWSEALTALQNQYGKQRPAYLIYKDIFQHSYEEYTIEEDFINDKYELLTELAEPKQSEKNKLDMIFALLPKIMQSKLQYSNTSNLVELKEQIAKLKWNQSNIEAKQSDNVNSQANVEPKEEINDRNEVSKEGNLCVSMDIPSADYIVIDKDPIIKVRRTEDLMPHVKREESEENTLDQEEEFISTENNTESQQDNVNTNLEIDADIMKQINSIIDESEMNCDSAYDNFQITSVMSAEEGPASAIAFHLNEETSNQAEVPTKNPIPRKQRGRCSYCRKYGHLSQSCFRKIKHMKLLLEEFMPKANKSSEESKEIGDIVTSNNDNDNENNISVETTAFTAPVLMESSNAITDQPAMPAAHTISQTTSLPPVPPTFSHITTMTSMPSTFSHTTTLTTKLIAPINGPMPNKQLAAKLRSSNGPSPKCHQCGTVGFYKSICPNCSPIYNSNQNKQ